MMWLNLKVKLGILLNHIPYTFVPGIGKKYISAIRDIETFERLTSEQRRKAIYDRVFSIVSYAVENIPFYREFYKEQGFSLDSLKDYEDIERIPVIDKRMLLEVPLERRSSEIKGTFVANTGGSSGRPLSFLKTKDLKIKEIAYLHHMWSTLGYKKSDLRLHFVGRNVLDGQLIYNFAENSVQSDVYTPFDKILLQLASLKSKIKFLHGYPSVLYEFALFCESHQDEYRKSGLDKTLKGAFLKSEFPHPLYRQKVESVFGIKTFSHYGHTEVCALAGEFDEPYKYDVMQSYGYVAIRNIDGEKHLVTTTYDNFASPLIQYDTEDVIDRCIEDNGVLQSFKMDGGRRGEFIIDRSGKKLSLTGVIFGKHHKLFDFCSQIQIGQKSPGEATVYYVPKQALPQGFDASDYFESQGIDIDFSFVRLSEPIKTRIGKVLLRVEDPV